MPAFPAKMVGLTNTTEFISNCVGEITIPKMLPLPIPDVTVNTRKGVFVNYTPAEIAG